MKTREAQSVAETIAGYKRMGDELYDEGVRAELCGCEKCKVIAREAACVMVIYGAAIHAIGGNHSMLDEIHAFMLKVVEKYPSPNK